MKLLNSMIIIYTCFLFSNLAIAAASFDHSHSAWNAVLAKQTKQSDHQTLFNYKAVKADSAPLNSYLKQLEQVSKEQLERFTQREQLAFWINAYNAYTIQIVTQNYPLKSIKDISNGGFFSSLIKSGPWKKEFINLVGQKLSLDGIEHGIIRKNFKEPRIHFAVNCASIGCPSLLPEAFTAQKMETQLNKAALNFLTNKFKNSLKGKTLHLSKIFKWYGDDFKARHGGFKNYIIKTLKLPNTEYEVEFKSYDWNLNELK